MSRYPSPTAIADDRYWLRSKHVSDSPTVAGDGYFDRHDVPHWEDVTADDLPPSDDDAVRALDREALEKRKTIGKWQLTGSAERIEELWPQLVDDAAEGTIWAVKAMTATGYAELPYDDYMLVVYTPNYFAKGDVDRVREYLREEYDVTHELFYKPDVYTVNGIVADTAAEWGLSMPARYRG